ncbi:MAG: Hsp33 family molecular chaperone HslO [Porticoccaceae bacterium]|nr:Hsp33 family molecular chaperone HslO [Porticoccaceae bacterium]
MNRPDQLHRFIFDHSDIRGEIVSLSASYRKVLSNGRYPPPVGELLGEMLSAAGLLSATMKFDGTLTLQARGEGSLKLLMADCTRHHSLRGIAKTASGETTQTEQGTFPELIGRGHLAITIDPAQGERYQGIVPLEAPTLSGCLEHYFSQSEQLPTRLWLFADGRDAGGLLLQALPTKLQSGEEREVYWQHLCTLADTITAEEMLSLESETILTRLFHQEKLRLFEPRDMDFACSCSESRTAEMLLTLGEEEVMGIVEEMGSVEIDCQFCHQHYRFDRQQVESLFSQQPDILH